MPKVLQELRKYKCKKVVVLDRGDQKTIKSISNFDCKIIRQKTKGYGAALIEGIQNIKTKYFCIFNADGSFDPKSLSKMYNSLIDNNYDFVFASRYIDQGGSEDDTILTYIGNKIFTFFGNLLFDLQISDILFTYILGNKNKFAKLNLKSKDFRLCVEIPLKIKRKKFRYECLASLERSRIAGKKKVNEFVDGFLILSYMINFFFKIDD